MNVIAAEMASKVQLDGARDVDDTLDVLLALSCSLLKPSPLFSCANYQSFDGVAPTAPTEKTQRRRRP